MRTRGCDLELGLDPPPSCRLPLVALPKFGHQARKPLGPDPHLKRVLLHVDPLDEQLDAPSLLTWELAPNGGEVGEQAGDLALDDLVLALALCRRFLLQRRPLDRAGTGRRSGMSPLLTAFGTTWK